MAANNQALAVADPQTAVAPASPMEMIQLALSTGTAPEVIRELVALQQSMERFNWEREERQAKIAFDEALNECQRQVGRVAPNVNRKDTNSWWADYAQLDAATRPIYTRYGFSITFSEVEPITPGKVRIKASLSRAGISKDYFREITPSTTGPKGGMMATATDADAIAGSRAKRYLLLDIFNIAVGIDKEEKKGIPHEGMQPELLKGWLDKMRAATNPGELALAYHEAYKAADHMADKAAMFDIIKCNQQEKAKYR